MQSSLVEILSVPYAINKNGHWNLKCYEIDLNSVDKQRRFTEYPLSQNHFLPIGSKIENGLYKASNTRKVKDYIFTNFNDGSTGRLKDLTDKVYGFPVLDEIYKETYVYSVIVGNRKVVFFTYELFRKFLGYPPEICQYLFEPFMLEMMLDNSEKNEKDGLYLTFNALIKKKYLDSEKFRQQYVSLLFHEGLNKYWKQLMSKTIAGRNHFVFDDPPFNKLNISAEIKEYKDFDLVLSINSMEALEDFQIENFQYSHPKITESKPRENGDKKKKKSKYEINLSRNYDLSKNSGTSKSENKEVSIGRIQPGFTFQNNINFEKIKQPYDQIEKPRVNKSFYKEFTLKDLEVSFNDTDSEGTASRPSSSYFEDQENFDLSEIPIGLQEFCSAIKILSKYFGISFNYELIPIEDELETPILRINGKTRYAVLIILLDSSNICLLEIDSSDEKYISTLMFKDVPSDKIIDFVKGALRDMSKRGGSWNIQKIKKEYKADKIKHPKALRRYEKMIPQDKEKVSMYRLATKLINILNDEE
ncbi:MAG: Tn7-like element transposition protein TnsE [Candidatus Cyclobacteriaceae bacterium M2_1C_046]